MELAWRSSSVMECHATARGSIPAENGVKLSFTSFARDSKWGCRRKMSSLSMGRKTQPTNNQFSGHDRCIDLIDVISYDLMIEGNIIHLLKVVFEPACRMF